MSKIDINSSYEICSKIWNLTSDIEKITEHSEIENKCISIQKLLIYLYDIIYWVMEKK